MLTIYSVGDAWYLGKVMDAIAMISGSNEGFVGASMVAALIGVFVIGFQSILKITLNIHELLVCYIIYMGCFSIQTDVVIESVYSDKTVIQKDNVPYGPAVLGSIISEIGYKLTQKMEVAFSDVHQGTLLTDPNGSQGYANALYLINNLARWSEKNGADTLPTAQNSSFAKNIRTYAMDCTTKALYLGKEFGGKEWKDLKTNSFINALGFNSDVYGTELYINNRAESYTCKEGINAIKNEFKNMLSAIDAGGNESARKEMLVNVGLCKNTQECNANIATNITDLVQNNLDALRVRNYDINDFMMAAVGMNELYTGLSLGYSSMFDKQSATMILNAVQQRNIQWGAEQNMFLQSVRPMLSFIEGLFYAISPFAAIMVMLGLFGLKIFFKYIILLIWIQLWLPIMAIANHYIMASASEAIDKLPYQGTGDNMGMSLYFYENLVQICQTKIAVGGMMMAATPVLSLMLITGSVYAMTQLTNRMSGGDHINEKMIAPDVVGAAPIMAMQSEFKGNEFGLSNNAKAQNQFNIGDGLSLEKSNTFSSMNSISNSIGTTMEKLYAENGTMTDANSRAGAWNEMMSHGNAKDLTKTAQDIMTYARQKGMNIKESEIGGVALAVAGGKGVVGGMSASKGYSQDQIDLANAIVNNSDSMSTSTRAQTTSSVSSSYSDTFKNDDTYSKVGTSREGVSEQASKLKTLSNSYQEVEKYSAKYGSDAKYSEFDIISNVIGSKDELYYNGKFKEFTEQNLTSEEKKAVEYTARSLQRNDQKNGVYAGSYADQQYHLKALEQVASGKAALFAARMLNEVGVGPSVKPIENITDNTEHATGPNANDITRINNLSENTLKTEKDIAQNKTAEGQQMSSDARVEMKAEDDERKGKQEQVETKNKNNSALLDKGLLTPNYHKKVNFGDAISTGTVLKEVKEGIDGLVSQGFDPNYNSFSDTYQRIHHSVDGKFKPLEGGRNAQLVEATKQMLIMGEIASNGWLTRSPQEQEQLLNAYRDKALEVSKLATTYAMDNLRNEKGEKITAEEATATAGNLINSVNKTIMTGKFVNFNDAQAILSATR